MQNFIDTFPVITTLTIIGFLVVAIVGGIQVTRGELSWEAYLGAMAGIAGTLGIGAGVGRGLATRSNSGGQ
jgi:hypothetical protein